jgi:hypothetical protein
VILGLAVTNRFRRNLAQHAALALLLEKAV